MEGDRRYFEREQIGSVYMLMWPRGSWWNHSLNAYLAGRCFYDASLSPNRVLADYSLQYFGTKPGLLLAFYYDDWARNPELCSRIRGASRESDRAALARQRRNWLEPAMKSVENNGVYKQRLAKVNKLHTLAEWLMEVHRQREEIRKLRKAAEFKSAAARLDKSRVYTDKVLRFFHELADSNQGLVDRNEIPTFITANLYHGLYQGGAFGKLTFLHWSLSSYGRYGDAAGAANIERGYRHFPLAEADDVALKDIPFYNDWISHPVPDDYWRALSVDHRFEEVTAPALLTAGWYDFFLEGQLRDFGLLRKAWTPRVREQTRLLIGPWNHAFFNGNKGLGLGLALLGGLQIFSGALVGGVWLVLIGLFARGLAESSYQSLILRQLLGQVSVEYVMVRDPVTVPPDLTLDRLVDEYILGHGFRGLPVVEGGGAIGLILVGRLRAVPPGQRPGSACAMRSEPADAARCVAPETPLLEALAQMGRIGALRLLVLRQGTTELAGLLTQSGLARFVELRHALGAGDD